MRVLVIVVLLIGSIVAQDEERQAESESKPGCALPIEPAEPKEEFDCDAQKEFPLEEYQKALSADKQTSILVNSYEQPDAKAAAVCPKAPEESASEAPAQISSAITRWITLCPTWSYYIWRWAVYIPPYGRCYVITPIRVTRCTTRSCRWVHPFFFSRCRPQYGRVYFLAFCPRAPFRFVWSYTRVSRGCNCERLFCGYLRG